MLRVCLIWVSIATVAAVVRSSNKREFTVDSAGNTVKHYTENNVPFIPFDCDAGYDNRKAGWSHRKKEYCCEYHQKGCSPEAANRHAAIAAGRPPRDMTGKVYQTAEYIKLRDPTAGKRDGGDLSKGKPLRSLAGVSTAAKPAPPGIAFLGRGYNMLTGNLISTAPEGDEGYGLDVFQFEYLNGQTTPDGQYLIPDGTSALPLTSCNYDMSGHTINSLYAYQNDVKVNFGISGDVGPVSFNFGITSQNINDATVTGDNIFITNKIECQVYSLQVEPFIPPTLHPDFIAGINYLSNTSDPDKYNFFLSQFGTSFISSAKLGGRQGFQTQFSSTTYKNFLESQIDVQASVGFQNYATLGLNANSTYSQNEAVTSATLQTTRFNVGGTFSPTMATYQANVMADPAPIFLTTQPISDLLGPPYWNNPTPDIQAKQSLLVSAIADFCTYLGTVKNITNPCTPPPVVPPLTVPPVPSNAVHQMCIRNNGAYELTCTVGVEDGYGQASTGGFSNGQTRCVDGSAIGAKRGQWLYCQCTATAGKSVGCQGGYPYYETTAMNGWMQCSGSTMSINCGMQGVSEND